MPPHITSTTGMDALTHAVEAYTNLFAPKSTDKLAIKAVKLIFENLEKVYKDGTDITARYNMQLAAYYAGAAFTRACVGYVHSVAHTLGGLYGTPHGLANAVILPCVMEHFGPAVYFKLARLAEAVGINGKDDEEKAKAFIREIRRMNTDMRIQSSFDFIQEKDILQMIKWAMKEANPIYPVPVLWHEPEFRALIDCVCARSEQVNGSRYERQMLLPEIGFAGQATLAAASVLVVGCGGLGSTLLYDLCSMGIGRIGFCDGDIVSLNNLNRQFLHTPADIGRRKVQSAYEKLRAYAPELTLEPHDVLLTDDNALALVSRYDLVLLAVDSIASRLITNRACVKALKPLVDAGIHGLTGSVYTYLPGKTACLACFHTESIKKNSTAIPSFAPIVSAISSLEAQCAANILLGLPNPTDGRMLLFDGATMTTEFVTIARNQNCTVCS
ncbi:MAG: hypothetical protein C0413_00105 [Clostridiales bacterium]|nr:hypothetical protein [Clostridiales bacterium]